MILSLCIRACYNTQVFTVVPNALSKLCALGSMLNILFVLWPALAHTQSCVKSLINISYFNVN